MPSSKLAALVVTFNSAEACRLCVASLLSDTAVDEVVVVDNASMPAERPKLDDLGAAVRLQVNPSNRGYAAAVNQAAAMTSAEFLLVSNADVLYGPSTVTTLCRAWHDLDRPAAIAPRMWWDEEGGFLLPQLDPVTPWGEIGRRLLGLSAWSAEWLSRRYARRCAEYGTRRGAWPVRALSGACMLTHRAVLQHVGPWDEGFGLYFEDTDWCRRARLAGYSLYVVPAASAIHAYSQSARHDSGASAKFAESARHYMIKHWGRWAWAALHRASSWKEASPPRCRDLGAFGPSPPPPQEPSVPAGSAGPYLLQLGLSPWLIPSAWHVTGRSELAISAQLWRRLAPGRYVARLRNARLEPLASWSWTKLEDNHAS